MEDVEFLPDPCPIPDGKVSLDPLKDLGMSFYLLGYLVVLQSDYFVVRFEG